MQGSQCAHDFRAGAWLEVLNAFAEIVFRFVDDLGEFTPSERSEGEGDAAAIRGADLPCDEALADEAVDEFGGGGWGETEKSGDVGEHGVFVPTEEGEGAELRHGEFRAAAVADLHANDAHEVRDDLQHGPGAFVSRSLHTFDTK